MTRRTRGSRVLSSQQLWMGQRIASNLTRVRERMRKVPPPCDRLPVKEIGCEIGADGCAAEALTAIAV